MHEQPIETTTYVGWSGMQAGIVLLLIVLLITSILVSLLYLQMSDVAQALQQQAVSCARQ